MTEEAKKLTLDDPVDSDTLKRLAELRDSEFRLGKQLIDIELEKIRLMVAARQIDSEKQRFFEKILMDRSLPPTYPVEIDGQSGKIKSLVPQPPPQKEKPEEATSQVS